MLSLASKAIRSDSSYHLALAAEAYYLEAGCGGYFRGTGAARLGLPDRIDAQTLRNLLKGLSPDGTYAFVQNAGSKNRQAAYELVFAESKYTSTLWSQLGPSARLTITEGGDAALAKTLSYLERTLGVTRRGKGGQRRESADLIFAVFPHTTARPVSRTNSERAIPDPHLHWHVLVLNLGVRADGSTGTILSAPLYRAKMLLGALFRAEAAAEHSNRHGLTIHPTHIGYYILGVPEKLCEDFSKRRAQIEGALESRGSHSPRAADIAALKTRDAKTAIAPAELFQSWQEQGRARAWSTRQAEALLARARSRTDSLEHPEEAILQAALYGITEEHSHFSAPQYLRRVAELAPGTGLGIDQLERASLDFLNTSTDVVRLANERGADRYTSQELYTLEAELIQHVREASSQVSHRISHRMLERTSKRHNLSSEQADALRYFAHSGRVAALEGYAGTGKTTLFAAYRDVCERAGLSVVGVTLSAKAAGVLHDETGMRASSIARFLWNSTRDPTDPPTRLTGRALWLFATWRLSLEDLNARIKLHSRAHDIIATATGYMSRREFKFRERIREFLSQFRLTKKHVLVIDEASMVGTRTLHHLMTLARDAGAKVILSGDHRQLQSIDAGAPFHRLARELNAPELTTIHRQHEEWMRDAVRDAAHGRAERVLKEYTDRGRLSVSATRQEAKAALISRWIEQGGAQAPEHHLLLAATRVETSDLNRLARASRKATLSGPALTLGTESFQCGDRVLFTQNRPLLGVWNGNLGTVTAVHSLRRLLKVRLDSGEHVAIPLRTYQWVTHGYCLTTHKAQGITVDHSYVLLGGKMQHRELSYVQFSRARKETWLFTDAFERPSLAEQLRESRMKKIAHDLERENGIALLRQRISGRERQF